jgi:short-subunit dehydrogenase
MGGFLPVPGQTAYGASKAAVKLFTEGLHSELLPTSVHVTAVFPGAIATNITANSGVTMGGSVNMENAPKIKMTTPTRAAEIIVDGMEKNKFHVLVGSDAKMMDFLVRLMPERAAMIIYTQMRSLLPD